MASKRYPAGPLQTPRTWYVNVTIVNPDSKAKHVRTYSIFADSITEAIAGAKQAAINEWSVSVKNLDVTEAGLK